MKKSTKIIMAILWSVFGIALVLTGTYNAIAQENTCLYAWILPAIALIPALSFTLVKFVFLKNNTSYNLSKKTI
ncbi:MAG: hypothetical protein K2I67_02605 [Malacoplasma sp.]|nr:hypothetical protein [Malacoplasma sp.]